MRRGQVCTPVTCCQRYKSFARFSIAKTLVSWKSAQSLHMFRVYQSLNDLLPILFMFLNWLEWNLVWKITQCLLTAARYVKFFALQATLYLKSHTWMYVLTLHIRFVVWAKFDIKCLLIMSFIIGELVEVWAETDLITFMPILWNYMISCK
jgi:hypothetical protein